ncbi:hypothetical protein DFP72DRAFT_854812 [Ephemerocybe angulata]|uniref:Uncharacterized protein n=1 Tax=Ephemerocybe angulata TaxID=980116 RepID=A0A8H6LZN7_9AGAR|nr:hypothetical protein DFP72DRAFT_854812 [Tulosesus angulatus]
MTDLDEVLPPSSDLDEEPLPLTQASSKACSSELAATEKPKRKRKGLWAQWQELEEKERLKKESGLEEVLCAVRYGSERARLEVRYVPKTTIGPASSSSRASQRPEKKKRRLWSEDDPPELFDKNLDSMNLDRMLNTPFLEELDSTDDSDGEASEVSHQGDHTHSQEQTHECQDDAETVFKSNMWTRHSWSWATPAQRELIKHLAISHHSAVSTSGNTISAPDLLKALSRAWFAEFPIKQELITAGNIPPEAADEGFRLKPSQRDLVKAAKEARLQEAEYDSGVGVGAEYDSGLGRVRDGNQSKVVGPFRLHSELAMSPSRWTHHSQTNYLNKNMEDYRMAAKANKAAMDIQWAELEKQFRACFPTAHAESKSDKSSEDLAYEKEAA